MNMIGSLVKKKHVGISKYMADALFLSFSLDSVSEKSEKEE